MKKFKKAILVLSVFFIAILLIGVLLTSINLLKLNIEINQEGFVHIITAYSSIKGLFTIVIALLTVYFILFQIENISISTKRTEIMLNNEIKTKTFEQARFYYIEVQPLIHEIYTLIGKREPSLLKTDWNYEEFTDESINEQSPEWENIYEKLPQPLKDMVVRTLNNFEFLSAIILEGGVDKRLLFNLIGKPLITQLKVFYPFISAYRTRKLKNDEYRYPSIVTLYREWVML